MSGFIADLFPVLILLAIGFAAGRKNLLSQATIEGMNRLVATITLPILLFKAFSSTHIESNHVVLIVGIFTSCAVMGVLGSLIAKATHLPQPSTAFLFQGFEAGMLGYALYGTLFGLDTIPRFATVDLGQVVFVFTVLAMQISRSDRSNQAKRTTPGSLVLAMFKSPVIIAIVAGLAASAFGGGETPLPWSKTGILRPTLDLVGGLTSPLVCLSVGFGLRNGVKGGGKVVLATLSRLGIASVLGFLIAYALLPILGIDDNLAPAVVTLFLLPPPFVISIFRKNADDADYISGVLSFHTIVSLAAITMYAAAVKGLGI